MLLTTREEIESYLPTNKWKDAQSLLSFAEEEETNVLQPVLGQPLLDYLTERYEVLCSEEGGITPQEFPVEKVDDVVRLIRMCQKVILYMALANNSGLLTVSFNPGGGLNMMSAENYETADKESVQRFERDAFKKAHRNIDSILTLLERDARSSKPLFADKWRESRYYYRQSHLLITTAMQMQEYLDIKGSREKYIELVPDLRYAQNTYIAPRIGDELMKAFIASLTSNDVVPTIREEQDENTSLRNREIKEHWDEAIFRLSSALVGYAEHRNVKMRRDDSLSEADMSMARALDFIQSHQDCFLPYIKSSPLYVEPESAPTVKQNRECREAFDYENPENMVTVFRPTLQRY